MAKIYIENYDNLDDIRKRPGYLISNEHLKPAVKFLRNLYNFDFYDGVCGGGTQNLYLLETLHHRNSFKKITLVDSEKKQLKNFKRIVEIYNSTKDEKEYKEKIISNHQIFIHFYNRLNYLTKAETKVRELDLNRPAFSKDIRIKLINSDFNEYIRSIDLKGKHFIYASNICNFNSTSNATKIIEDLYYSLLYCTNHPKGLINFIKTSVIDKMSKPILENKSMLDGSILFAVGPASRINQPYPSIILIFKKQRNKLDLIKKYLQK
jgi:hypothetical protein